MRETFALYAVDDAEAAWLRAQQLSSVLRLTPWLMAANAFCALVVAAMVWRVSPSLLAVWLIGVAIVIGLALKAYRASRGRAIVAASRRAFRHSTRHAVALGGLWTAVPLLWFPDLDMRSQLIVVALTAGMMSAGAFVLGPLPGASLGYVGILVAGSFGAIWRSRGLGLELLSPLLLAYAAVCVLGSLAIGRKSLALLRSEREAERQRQMVAMLLQDFEEHANDALWETGADGRLVHASPRLGDLLDAEVADLLGEPLTDLIEQKSPGGGRVLGDAFGAGRAFRSVTLRVAADEHERWWQLRAKPVTGDSGGIVAWRGVLADATAEITAERRLRRLAHFDALTGLANRVTLNDAIGEHLRGGGVGALLAMDLDHFKAINDTFGHSTGDHVLAVVAARLRHLVRPGDVVARLGGDEFAILVRGYQDPSHVRILGQRLLAALAAPCEVDGRRHFVGLSIGVALLPDHGREADELLGNADLALYEAKSTGRGRVAVYSAAIGDRSRRRAALEQALLQAADRDELSLHWQPQVDVARWRIVGAEALIRWQHPTLGAVGPDEFIGVAEQAGMMTRVGEWVLREACRTAARSLDSLGLAVNISAAQLRDADFVALVREVLRESGIAPRRLEIELTESVFLGDTEAAVATLTALQDVGVRIALDDFGTGFSSLAYLRRFPFDTLKIDRTFIRELGTQEEARSIVGTILQLADAMRMRTVAEGVETTDQLSRLAGLGCQQVQGFLIARPAKITDLAALHAEWPRSSLARLTRPH